jgi:predicted CXXCH cytochrome family protein
MLVLLGLAIVGCEKNSSKPDPKPEDVVGASGEHYLTPSSTNSTNSANRSFVRATIPATRPVNTLPHGADCVTSQCHATFATAPHIHQPVAKNACDACHQDDIGGHVFPLKRQGSQTCTFCHSVSGMASHQHKALEQGCTSCHQPHASNAKFLLKADTVERTCALCHTTPLKKHAHEPFAKGDCTGCHQPHESNFAFLLRGGEGANHCFTCHEPMRTSLRLASDVHKPVADCGTCHSPHATDFPQQLKKPIDETCLACHEPIKKLVAQASVAHGAMLTDKHCANCHDPHGSNEPRLLRHRMDRLCLTCHDKPTKAADGHTIARMKPAMESKYLHGAIRAGDCSACHDAHGGNEHDLLTAAFPRSFYTSFDVSKYALCFKCHEPNAVLAPRTTTLTGFRDGDENLHFVHVNRDTKGRSCQTCHAIHGSDLPNHMASEVPFEQSNWAMPMNFQKTSDGGSCAPGCHTPRTYSRSKLVFPSTSPSTTRGVP